MKRYCVDIDTSFGIHNYSEHNDLKSALKDARELVKIGCSWLEGDKRLYWDLKEENIWINVYDNQKEDFVYSKKISKKLRNYLLKKIEKGK
jgi:siroheme synthase (precorrin-2 oxidase/ferrochelatase)